LDESLSRENGSFVGGHGLKPLRINGSGKFKIRENRSGIGVLEMAGAN